MKVSVLTPIYRTDECFLREAIESVLSQTFTDFEFILLDDCPADDREQVVKSYQDDRIVYLKNESNLGIAASRNKLIDMARGQYLAVFDHDDICHPERFSKEVAFLDAHPECGVVGGWTRLTSNGSINKYPEEDHDIKYAMMHKPSVWHPAAMIRRSVLDDHAIRYEGNYSPVEDYMLWMKLIPHTVFHNLQEVVIDYRWHAGNTSNVRKRQLMISDMRTRAWANVNLRSLYTEYELRRESVKRIRVCGLPLFKISSSERRTEYRLFDRFPIVRIEKRFEV